MIRSRRTKPRPGRVTLAAYAVLRLSVFERDGHCCRHCVCGERGLECDHIINRSQRGQDKMSNLISLCPPCHREKTDCRLFIIGDADTAQFTTDNPRRKA